MKLKFSIVVLLIVLLTGCVSNKPNSPSDRAITSLLPGGALLIGFNRNDDYVIDKVEFDEGCIEAFKQADMNDDGVINLSEFRFWQPKAMGSISALPNIVFFDRNFNDEITRGEFDAALEKMFRAADENKDQQASYEELVTIVAPPVGKPSKLGSSQGRGGKRGEGRGRGRNF